MKELRKILLIPVLALMSVYTSAQLFNKPNPGYIVYEKDGAKKEGFVKTKTTSEKDGIISLYFSEKQEDKKPLVVKTKELSEFKLNDVTYLRKKIKVSLIRSSEMFCPALYISDRIQVVFNPSDVNDRNLSPTFIGNSAPENEITIGRYFTSEFHIFKDGKYTKVTALTYGKDMKSLFGDNDKWMEKANNEKGWLKFDNILENIQFYEK